MKITLEFMSDRDFSKKETYIFHEVIRANENMKANTFEITTVYKAFFSFPIHRLGSVKFEREDD